MKISQQLAARTLAAASFLFGATPANRYAAPILADWLAEQGAATSSATRFRVGARYAATLGITFAFLLSRVERDGALAGVWPPLLLAVPGLITLQEVGLAASQALWLTLGAAVFFSIASIPPHRLIRASRMAPALLACVGAGAAWSGSGYWRVPLTGLVVAPAELVKPFVILAAVALVGTRGRSRIVHAATLTVAGALGAIALAGPAASQPADGAFHTDLILRSVLTHVGVPGAVAVALGLGALLFGLVQGMRAGVGPAASGAWALLVIVSTETALHVGGAVGALPVLGVPLPFVSYGGSAIAGTFAAIAVVHALARPGRARRDWHEVAHS